jgi:hypothetical protein
MGNSTSSHSNFILVRRSRYPKGYLSTACAWGCPLEGANSSTWRTLQVNREGQITERFTQAIDQLGATDDKGNKLFEIRLGGIYALERIARESEEDYWPIMEILTATSGRMLPGD